MDDGCRRARVSTSSAASVALHAQLRGPDLRASSATPARTAARDPGQVSVEFHFSASRRAARSIDERSRVARHALGNAPRLPPATDRSSPRAPAVSAAGRRLARRFVRPTCTLPGAARRHRSWPHRARRRRVPDQQPLLLVPCCRPAHQRPAAVQLRAVEPERQLARAVAVARRAMPPSASTSRPDGDGSRAVVAGRDLAFERRIRADDPRRARPAASPTGRRSVLSAPPMTSACRRVRGGNRSAAAVRDAPGSRSAGRAARVPMVVFMRLVRLHLPSARSRRARAAVHAPPRSRRRIKRRLRR